MRERFRKYFLLHFIKASCFDIECNPYLSFTAVHTRHAYLAQPFTFRRTGLVVDFVVCSFTRWTVKKLMNGCFDFTVVHEASDGWACFGLITGFTRGLRIAVNQGPHYKSCRLRRASSHPNLMSQQILPLCCLLVSWESERSAAFYCQVKLFILFIYLFQIAAHKPIKNKFLILQQHPQCMLGFDALQHNSH